MLGTSAPGMQCKPTWLQWRLQLRLRRGRGQLKWHDPDLVRPCATTLWLRELLLPCNGKESIQSCECSHTHNHNLLTADTIFDSTSSTLCTWERHFCSSKAFPFLNIRHDDHKENGSGRFIVRSSFCDVSLLFGAWSTSDGFFLF